MPLNAKLYALLLARFGHVTITAEGEPMTSRYIFDPRTGGEVLEIIAWGESYAVNCPYCNDTRHRLSINHRFGVPDPVTGSENLFLATCFNEDCLRVPGMRAALKDRVFGLLNRDQRRQMVVPQGPRPLSVSELVRKVEPPGEVVRITDLPDDHTALVYLRTRGFDPAELSTHWEVTYCTWATHEHRLAQGRLIIPVIMGQVWVGWQARHIGEEDWKRWRLPKYVNMRSFQRSQALYNHDLARWQPLVVICEGPTDVWRVGPAGVALLGKTASRRQLELLTDQWVGKPAVILLDGDAAGDTYRLRRQLEPIKRGPLVEVKLPPGRDPGSYSRAELWSMIRQQASCQGIALPGAAGGDGPSA